MVTPGFAQDQLLETSCLRALLLSWGLGVKWVKETMKMARGSGGDSMK